MLDILKKDNVALAIIATVTISTILTTLIALITIVIAAKIFKTSDKQMSSFMKRNKLAQ